MRTNLNVAVSSGSLWQRIFMYLILAGYDIFQPDRKGYCGTANGVAFYQFDRRMVPYFLTKEPFDAGITGYDLFYVTGLGTLREVARLQFSRNSDQPTRWVLAQRNGFKPIEGKNVRIACELPRLAKMLFRKQRLPFSYEIVKIDGSEEACVAYDLADMVLVVTETGESLRSNGLEIVPGYECMLESTPVILAKTILNPIAEQKLQALRIALETVVGAKAFVMLTFDMPSRVGVSSLSLPSSVSPTVSPLLNSDWRAYEVCIPRSELGSILLKLRTAGARGIVMREVEGYLP